MVLLLPLNIEAMKRCFVCGEERSPDGVCTSCNTDAETLVAMARYSRERRFLFGQAPDTEEPPETVIEVPEPTPMEGPRKIAQVPPPIRRVGMPVHQPLLRDFEDEGQLPSDDLILARDGLDPIPAAPSAPGVSLPIRGLAHLIDVVFCVLLNVVVFWGILRTVQRDVDGLVSFSLLPVLFVFMAFTAQYFTIFMGLFKKSAGRVIAERLLN